MKTRRYMKSLRVMDFRNISSARVEFSPGTNVIYGENGNGKTNLLEAVWLFTGGKSFRGARDREMIGFKKRFFSLEGKVGEAFVPQDGASPVEKEGAEEDFSLLKFICHSSDRRFSSRMAKTGASGEYVTPTRVIGNFYRVIFSPRHMEIISGGPAVRRRFVDACLCQLYPSFIESWRKYNKVIAQRNAYLRSPGSKDPRESRAVLEVYDDFLAEHGSEICKYRKKFVEALSFYASGYYDRISGGREEIDFVYNPSALDKKALLEKFISSRERDIANGNTLVGPHREDIGIDINGAPARTYASQGQQRSAVVAMKLAECDIMEIVAGTAPAILLDDVLSELDSGRQDYLLNNISGRQTFITTCDPGRINISGGKNFLVEKGEIKHVP